MKKEISQETRIRLTPELAAAQLRIRMVPELNTWAITHHRDRQLWLYYLLRAISNHYESGSGKVDLELAKEILVNRLRLYSPRSFYRHLALGMGKWWISYENRRTRIKILALEKVCEYSNTCPSKFVDITVGDIPHSGYRQARCALLFNTGAYKPMWQHANPISRQSLEEKTGIQRRTQQRYDLIANTTRIATEAKWRDPVTHKLRHGKQLIMTRGGPVNINKQLGNVYHSKAEFSKRGMTQKIAKTVRGQRGSLNEGEATNEVSMVRRYYRSFKDFFNAHKRHSGIQEGYYPLKSNDTVLVACTIW